MIDRRLLSNVFKLDSFDVVDEEMRTHTEIYRFAMLFLVNVFKTILRQTKSQVLSIGVEYIVSKIITCSSYFTNNVSYPDACWDPLHNV